MDKIVLQRSDAFRFTVIRKQYSRMPVEEIASLIDSSPAFVQDFIDNHLAGSGQLSYEETIELKEKEAVKAKDKRKLKAANAAQAKKKTIVTNANKPVKERREDKRLPTKQTDYSQLQTLRIDHKTIIYIQPGENKEKAIQRYQKAVERGKPTPAPKKVDPAKGTKICTRCKKQKPFDDYSKATNTDDGYRDMCKKCNAQNAKLYAVNRREGRRLFI